MEIKLTLKQERFCQLYAGLDREFFGNGTRAYIEAYNIDITQKGQYLVARAGAYENLTKPHITARIRELIDTSVLNDERVDKELAFLIDQDAELGVKMNAIKEYNALKARVLKRLDLSSAGKPLNNIKFVFSDDDSDEEEDTDQPQTETSPTNTL